MNWTMVFRCSVSNSSGIVSLVEILSSTKNSLVVTWLTQKTTSTSNEDHKNGDDGGLVGYLVQYQAKSSSIVQESSILRPSDSSYDIRGLHENTYYNVCVRAIENRPSLCRQVERPISCAIGSTSDASMSLAFVSTFGALLALSVIVMFVLVAKWQYHRRKSNFETKTAACKSRGDKYGETKKSRCVLLQENGDCAEDGGSRCDQSRNEYPGTCSFQLLSNRAGMHCLNDEIGLFLNDVALPDDREALIGQIFGSNPCCFDGSIVLTSPSNNDDVDSSCAPVAGYQLLVPLSSLDLTPVLVRQNSIYLADDDVAEDATVERQMDARSFIRAAMKKQATFDFGSMQRPECCSRNGAVEGDYSSGTGSETGGCSRRNREDQADGHWNTNVNNMAVDQTEWYCAPVESSQGGCPDEQSRLYRSFSSVW